jgi:putative membrane protein
MRHPFIYGAALTVGLLAGAAAFTPSWAAVSAADQQFINAAAIGGRFEVAAGQLAAKSTNPKVQAFGQRMVRDHSAADAQLAQLVKQQGGKLPAGLDAEHTQLRDHLASLKGDEFDRGYIALMVKDHDEDTKAFSDEERNTTDPKLKQFVEQTLTIVKEHDQMARQIAGDMGVKLNLTTNNKG